MKRMRAMIEDILYPGICLHCGQHEEGGGILFCLQCTLAFHFIEPSGLFFEACFVYDQAVESFIKALKSHKMPYLSKVAASFLLLQLENLPWSFDLIIPVPSHSWLLCSDPIYMMAQELAAYCHKPFFQPLKRKGNRPKQASLSKEERATLGPWDFIIKNNSSLAGSAVLLIDDVMTTGSTMRALSATLYEAEVAQVYGLSLAHTYLE